MEFRRAFTLFRRIFTYKCIVHVFLLDFAVYTCFYVHKRSLDVFLRVSYVRFCSLYVFLRVSDVRFCSLYVFLRASHSLRPQNRDTKTCKSYGVYRSNRVFERKSTVPGPAKHKSPKTCKSYGFYRSNRVFQRQLKGPGRAQAAPELY